MAYLIYDRNTTEIVHIMRDGYWQDAKYKTEGAAKAGLSRLIKIDMLTVGMKAEDAVIDTVENHAKIEKTKVVKNLMTGKDIVIPVNTPRSCDPSTELYGSM